MALLAPGSPIFEEVRREQQADTKAGEASAQKEYYETKKATDSERETATKQDEEQALTIKKSDLEGLG